MAAARAVLLLDGEELIGAKQNRVLNLTILAPAHSTLVIPVSCVEQGRWSYGSGEFGAAPHAYYAGGRAGKMATVSAAMRSSGARVADQHAVWTDIAAKAVRLLAASRTGAMAAIYDRHEASLEEFVHALPPVDDQAGALFAINGTVIGFDLFDYPATLRKLLPKLVRSCALDAIDVQRQPASAVSSRAAEALLQDVANAAASRFAAVGEGEDARLTAAGLTGAALVARARVVHLSAFRLVDAARGQRSESGAALSRPSARSRHRPQA
jgi:hypothetical protein